MLHLAYMFVWVGGPIWITRGGLMSKGHYAAVLDRMPQDEKQEIIGKLRALPELSKGQTRLLAILEGKEHTSVAADAEGVVVPLTENECEIVAAIAAGSYPDDIAEDRMISRYTMRNILRRISWKLTGDERGARAADLPAIAAREGACP